MSTADKNKQLRTSSDYLYFHIIVIQSMILRVVMPHCKLVYTEQGTLKAVFKWIQTRPDKE